MSYTSYWDQRAKLCSEFADEGECLAQVARHVPVTIGNYEPALGDTGQSIAQATTIIAGLLANPDATLQRYGPSLVTAADRHVIDPLLQEVGKAAAPYAMKYVLPPLSVLYIISGVGAYYSYKAADRLKKNPSRRRRRRTSRR